MKPSIEVTIEPDGQIKIDAIGFKGADCDQATRYLEEALGVIGQKQKKPEYHQRRSNTQNQPLGL